MRIGIDIGGTKIEAVTLDQTGRELVRRRTATPADNYLDTVRTVAELVASVKAQVHWRASVGIGFRGRSRPPQGW